MISNVDRFPASLNWISEAHLAAPLSAPGRTDWCIDERQFLEMERGFAAHGGFASDDEIARRLRQYHDQPLSLLARWIVDRSIISIVWRSRRLIPRFQFDLSDMSLRLETRHVVSELSAIFDDWELTLWCASPNTWLRNKTPVDLFADEPLRVLHAARADRFVARG